ncbi:MAG: zf-HC2 domain-containing protein [Gemmatimonas sp.]
MTDCSNAEIRDLLPDYVHDQLSVTDLARVEQHLVSCADCAEELALLQTVLAIRPQVRTLNIADILARLPKPDQFSTVTTADNAQVAAIDDVRDIASARSVARKTSNVRNWRAIAAVAVMTVSALSITMVRQNYNSNKVTPLADSSTVAELQTRSGPNALKGLQDSANAGSSDNRVSLSVGDPSDYTDEELQAMMARLDKWDGSTSAEPLPSVPILPPGS